MKSIFLLSLFPLLICVACSQKNSYPGYKVLKKQKVASIASKVVEMVHEKSGASIVLVKNKDQARSFMVGFRTPPYDDTGLFHIFEHSVLEGSRLYPSKSNFFHVVNSSVSSYANALTGSVYTYYPFVTRSQKDFNNLLSVYMDAVFFPKVLEEPRLVQREGWRYEVNPQTQKMSINGIVLSEMKGAFASPYTNLYYQMTKALIPQTPYAYESGGLPEKIATLTFKQIVEAHKKYYHPQNSIIYLYGDLDFKEQLAEIDKNFLSHFQKTTDYRPPQIQRQTNNQYERPIHYGTYPGQKGPSKDFLAKGYVFGDSLSVTEETAASVLARAFIDNNAAPLKLRLSKEGLASSTSAMGHEGKDNALSIVFEGTSEKNLKKIEQVLNEEIDKVIKEGLDPELLTSIVNKYEFSYKEKNSNGSHKGMRMGAIVLQNWIYQDEPLAEALDFVAQFKKLREKLKSDGYVQSFFKKYFKNNKRTKWLVLKPDPEFSRKFNAGLETQVQTALKEKPLSEYASEFKEYQQWVATKEPLEILNKTPTLKLSDIKADEKPIPVNKTKIKNVEVLQYPQQTSGISYVTLYFDLDGIKQEHLKNLEFLTSFIKKTNSTHYSFKELSKQIDTHIGGLGFGTSLSQSVKDLNEFKNHLVVGFRFIDDNKEKVMKLVQELLTQAQFEPTGHLQNLLGEVKTSMASSVSRRAPGLASAASSQSFYPELSAISSEISGISFENYILNSSLDANILSKSLKQMRAEIFTKQRLSLVSLTTSPLAMKAMIKDIEHLHAKLPDAPPVRQSWNFAKQTKHQGFIVPGEVQYIYKTMSYADEGLKFSGTMSVFSQYLDNHFMTPKLREQAGAYGAWSSFNRGLFQLGTFKDPNLKKSLKTFDEALIFMEKEQLNQDSLRPAILGSLKTYYSDKSIPAKSAMMTKFYLTDRTWDDYLKIKKQILTTTPQDIKALAKTLQQAAKKSQIGVAGNAKKIKEEAPFIKNLLNLQ